VPTPQPPEEQAPLVELAAGLEHLDPNDLKKITQEMARVVEARAMDQSMDQIADRENVTVNTLNKRLNRVHRLLRVQSTTAAYRLLLLAGILILK
jgi:DNA-binding CsgD family transcriptional regulator